MGGGEVKANLEKVYISFFLPFTFYNWGHCSCISGKDKKYFGQNSKIWGQLNLRQKQLYVRQMQLYFWEIQAQLRRIQLNVWNIQLYLGQIQSPSLFHSASSFICHQTFKYLHIPSSVTTDLPTNQLNNFLNKTKAIGANLLDFWLTNSVV